MPAKLRAPVPEAYLHRQVVGMAIGPHYRADARFPIPFLTIEQPHQRAYTGLARLHKNHSPIADAAGPVPHPDPGCLPLTLRDLSPGCNTYHAATPFYVAHDTSCGGWSPRMLPVPGLPKLGANDPSAVRSGTDCLAEGATENRDATDPRPCSVASSGPAGKKTSGSPSLRCDPGQKPV